jgi:hypothetical protein
VQTSNKPLSLTDFAVLPVRGLLYLVTQNPYLSKTVTGGHRRLTFGTGRPVVNRTPDGQGASCRSHENPHQHVYVLGFLLRGYRNYRKAIAMVESVEFHVCGKCQAGSGFWQPLRALIQRADTRSRLPDLPLPGARPASLSRDCSRRLAAGISEPCGVHLPELADIFVKKPGSAFLG